MNINKISKKESKQSVPSTVFKDRFLYKQLGYKKTSIKDFFSLAEQNGMQGCGHSGVEIKHFECFKRTR